MRLTTVEKTEKPFIFRGLIKCAVSGRMVTSDIKKGKYIYLICRNPDKPKEKVFVSESTILDRIKEVFESLQIAPELMEAITDHLKQSHDAEKEYHANAIKELEQESRRMQMKLDALLDHLLEKRITTEVYDKKCKELKERQYNINAKLKQHIKADDSFKITVSMVLTLASRAAVLFESSKIEQKRKLIGLVFSNLQLRGHKLEFSLCRPFDMMVNLESCQEWLGRQDSNLRMAVPKTAALPLGYVPL